VHEQHACWRVRCIGDRSKSSRTQSYTVEDLLNVKGMWNIQKHVTCRFSYVTFIPWVRKVFRPLSIVHSLFHCSHLLKSKKSILFLVNKHSASHLDRKKQKCRNFRKFIKKDKLKYHLVISIYAVYMHQITTSLDSLSHPYERWTGTLCIRGCPFRRSLGPHDSHNEEPCFGFDQTCFGPQ